MSDVVAPKNRASVLESQNAFSSDAPWGKPEVSGGGNRRFRDPLDISPLV